MQGTPWNSRRTKAYGQVLNSFTLTRISLQATYLKKQIKAHKSSEALSYVTSGWVKKSVMKLVSGIQTLAVFVVKLKLD